MADRQLNADTTIWLPAESPLPQPKTRSVQGYLRTTLKRACSFLSKFRASLASPTANTPVISCVDPAEAYLHACIAAPFFCYVSPAIYGLIGAIEERTVTPKNSRPGDQV